MNATEIKGKIIEIAQNNKYAIEKLINPIAKAEGLTSLQLFVLLILYKQKASNVGGVSELTAMGHANTSTLCKKLEKDGFLYRTRNKEDERVVMLTLTEKGIKASKSINTELKKFDAVISTLPIEMIQRIFDGMKAMEEVLKQLSSI